MSFLYVRRINFIGKQQQIGLISIFVLIFHHVYQNPTLRPIDNLRMRETTAKLFRSKIYLEKVKLVKCFFN